MSRFLLLTLLTLLCVLPPCQAQPASPAAPEPVAMAATPPTLRWDYAPAAPDRFVVRRSLDGGPWQDVAVLPGANGTGLLWQDATLPVSTTPVQAKYVVYAVVGTGATAKWSEASNVSVVTTAAAESEPIALGECVAVQRTKKRTTITCNLP